MAQYPTQQDNDWNLLRKIANNTGDIAAGGGSGGGAVSSVNALTGAVVLTPAIIGAASANFTGSTTLWVAKNGVDATGDGSIGRPYLTLAKALAVIATNADASSSKPYVIRLGTGTWVESAAWPPWIWLRGSGSAGNQPTYLNGTISDGTYATGDAFGFADLDVNLFAIATQSAAIVIKVDLTNVRTIGLNQQMTVGTGGIVQARNCIFEDAWLQNVGGGTYVGCIFQASALLKSGTFNLVGCTCANTMIIGPATTAVITGCQIVNYLGQDSATATTFDAVSYPTGTITLTGSTLSYSTSIGDTIKTRATGTAYSLTNASAALDFGTTDPVIIITKPGKWILSGWVTLQYNGATFLANRTVTIKIRRTNNTAADVTNSNIVTLSGIVTTVTGPYAVIAITDVEYTTQLSDDSLTLFGDVSVVPSAGSFQAVDAFIHAVKVK